MVLLDNLKKLYAINYRMNRNYTRNPDWGISKFFLKTLYYLSFEMDRSLALFIINNVITCSNWETKFHIRIYSEIQAFSIKWMRVTSNEYPEQ